MNLKVLKWLLTHQSQLLQIVEIAKGYSKTLPFIEQWRIVDKIAQIVIPILEAEAAKPKALTTDDIYNWPDTDDEVNREVQLLSAGTEVQALGIDWKTLVEVVIPLVIAILKALLREDE